MMSDRSTYLRAIACYDEAHEQALLDAIAKAVFEASMVTDANICAICTAECAGALLTVLANILVMSLASARSPTEIRKTCDAVHKKLRRLVAHAERNVELQEFLRRVFRGPVQGSA